MIASLAEQAKEAGIPVMIVTGDRDAYQLAENGTIRIMTTSRGIAPTRGSTTARAWWSATASHRSW